MTRISRPAIILLLLILAAVLGYLVSKSNKPNATAYRNNESDNKSLIERNQEVKSENKPLRLSSKRSARSSPEQAIPPFAISNEHIASFKTEDAYRKFIAGMKGRGLHLIARSDKLLALRFRLMPGSNFSPDELDDAQLGYNYTVTVPERPDAEAQADAVGFGGSALSWIGVEGNNADWGKGVTVAVLDSGVNNHIAFKSDQGKVTQIDLTELPNGSKQLGHGTAVASIIAGDHPLARGVAPHSDILSIRITDTLGSSDTFTLAQSIIEAVDHGANILNISMGSYGDSTVVRNAVQYAQDAGAVIVAASGNQGINTIAFPAAYEGVIAVGAIDANGEHLHFSNSGQAIDLVAPGYQVNAAWGEDLLTAFSGTSASTPYVSGAIAATMTAYPHLSAQQAADLVLNLTNDGGYPGADPDYGTGSLAVDRVMEHGTPGIYDAAIASQFLVLPNNAATALPHVLVTVQNQGTETLINSPLTINSPAGTQQINISSLAPSQIQTFQVPITFPNNGDSISIRSGVQINGIDQEPANNSRNSHFSQPSTEKYE